ncbi:MAG: cell wall hydrolase [Pseudomonadota bacterium]
MKRFFLAAACAVAALLPDVSFADKGVASLIEREQASLDALPGSRFRKYLSSIRPRQKPVEVSYSKAWLDEQPMPQGGEQWRCLSEALYFEARGETVKGQFAVAEVIMNRVKSSRFPNTLCGVIRQGTGRKYQCQFTYTCDGHKEIIAEKKAYERVSKVARSSIDGVSASLTDGATHYHTTAVRPKWSRVYKKTAKIGVHIFYRHNYRTASSN